MISEGIEKEDYPEIGKQVTTKQSDFREQFILCTMFKTSTYAFCIDICVYFNPFKIEYARFLRAAFLWNKLV